MIRFCNAKVNLGLLVGEKKVNGYHNIESVFLPVPWFDALEIIEQKGVGKKSSFQQTGLKIEGDLHDNLVWKAYQLIDKKYNIPQVQIHLHKKIPTGAGMGGGSSNASFTLMMLNDLFELNLSYDELLNLALELGSDCPFFIYNKPALVKGRGEIIQPLSLNLSNLYFYCIFPQLHISTLHAFRQLDLREPKGEFDNQELVLELLTEENASQWRNIASNDFEIPAFKQYPILKSLKNNLYDSGAIYASMTGSGSAVYGLFHSPVKFELESHGFMVKSGSFNLLEEFNPKVT